MAFCRNCGAQLADGSAFCSSCGTSQSVSSTVATAPTQAPAGQPSPSATSAPMTSNVAGALAYITIVGIIFLIIDPYKRDRFVRFHAFQSVFFAVACIIVYFVLSFVVGAMLFTGAFTLIIALFRLVELVIFLAWLFLMYKAYNNQQYKLPVIGDIAEKQAAANP